MKHTHAFGISSGSICVLYAAGHQELSYRLLSSRFLKLSSCHLETVTCRHCRSSYLTGRICQTSQDSPLPTCLRWLITWPIRAHDSSLKRRHMARYQLPTYLLTYSVKSLSGNSKLTTNSTNILKQPFLTNKKQSKIIYCIALAKTSHITTYT